MYACRTSSLVNLQPSWRTQGHKEHTPLTPKLIFVLHNVQIYKGKYACYITNTWNREEHYIPNIPGYVMFYCPKLTEEQCFRVSENCTWSNFPATRDVVSARSRFISVAKDTIAGAIADTVYHSTSRGHSRYCWTMLWNGILWGIKALHGGNENFSENLSNYRQCFWKMSQYQSHFESVSIEWHFKSCCWGMKRNI